MQIKKYYVVQNATLKKDAEFVKKEDPQLMIYNEGKPRVRSSDGLHIYPMICFNCKTMTECASDTENQSGNAVEGMEYFKTKKLEKKS